jgi:ABC-type sugar transport system permease subunit
MPGPPARGHPFAPELEGEAAMQPARDATARWTGVVTPATARRRRRWGDVLAPYLFISPFVVSFLVLFVGPALYSLVLSFYRYKGYGKATYVGFDNYRSILDYHVFWTALKNTIFYWLAHVIPLMVISFLLALLVRSKLIKYKSFYKPIIFLPNVVVTVGAALVFQSLFGSEYGVINNLLGTDIRWLDDPSLRKWVVVFLLVWQGVGWWFVVYLAGLTGINPDIEEAALVDGASARQRLFSVTIPLMRSTFLFAFVFDAINSLRLFTQPNVLVARGGSLAPNDMAPVLNLLLRNLRAAQFGQAAAVGWIIFVIIAGITIFQFRLFRDSSDEMA